MTATAARAFAATAMLLALAGCGETDPYLRTDVWRPTGANAQNIVAQLANPLDMVRGHGAVRVDAHSPTTAVEQLWGGRAAKSPEGGAAAGTTTSGGPAAGGEGGAGASTSGGQ